MYNYLMAPSRDDGNAGGSGVRRRILWEKAVGIAKQAKSAAEEDPRRIVHSLKVALAVTLVSLFYYFEPTALDGYGVSSIWAILTVLLVFDFSVGSTLEGGATKLIATSIAAAIAIKAHSIATHAGEKGEPILIASFVFIAAAAVTFARFFPGMKRYECPLLTFGMTFCLISVSGYRDDEVLVMAKKRLIAVSVGSVVAVAVCVVISPVWSGLDLNRLIAANIRALGGFLEGGLGPEYFEVSKGGELESGGEKRFVGDYKAVLTSQGKEENLAYLARWEPSHGRFKFRHPWNQYLQLGNLSRECAYKIEALNAYLQAHNSWTGLLSHGPNEIPNRISTTCTRISSEAGKAMNELAASVETMTKSRSADPHLATAKTLAEDIRSLLHTSRPWDDDGGCSVLDIVSAAAVVSLLNDVVACCETMVRSVDELASAANFNSEEEGCQRSFSRGSVIPVTDIPRHVIIVERRADS